MWNNNNNNNSGNSSGATSERSRAAPKLVDYFYELQRRTALTATVPPILAQQQQQQASHGNNNNTNNNNDNDNNSSIFEDKAYGQANTERILNWMENETKCLRDESGGSSSCARQDDEHFPECPDGGEHLEKKDSIPKTNKAEFLVKSKAMALRNVEKLLNASTLSDTKSEKKSEIATADNYDKNPTEEPLIVDTCNTGSKIDTLNNNNVKNENLRAQNEPNTSENKLNIDLDGCTLLDMANITPKTHEYDPTTTESFTVLSSEDEKRNNLNKFINDENAVKSKNKHSIKKNDLKTKTASKSKRVRNSLNSIKLSPLLSISDQNNQRLVVNSKRDYLAVTRTRVIKVPKPSPWEEHITKVLEKRDLKKLKSKSFI